MRVMRNPRFPMYVSILTNVLCLSFQSQGFAFSAWYCRCSAGNGAGSFGECADSLWELVVHDPLELQGLDGELLRPVSAICWAAHDGSW